MKERITHERLKQRLRFDHSTATFTWLACPDVGDKFNEQWAGRAAGSVDKDGWFTITVDGRRYHATELLWFYVTGQWPKARETKRKARIHTVSGVVSRGCHASTRQ
jgi:hypothetical protein